MQTAKAGLKMSTIWLAATLFGVGCQISTVGGPLFDSKSLGDQPASTFCVTSYAVDVRGSANVVLEQQARVLWQESLGSVSDCNNGGVRIEVSDLVVRTRVDAYGEPAGDPQSAPPRARSQLTSSARVAVKFCALANEEIMTIGSSVWQPYVADPFLRQEQQLRGVRQLVDQDLDLLRLKVDQLQCDLVEDQQ